MPSIPSHCASSAGKPQAHQRAGDRQVVRQAEVAELLRRVGVDDAAAAVDHRPARGWPSPWRPGGSAWRCPPWWAGSRAGAPCVTVRDVRARQVLRHVDQHRPGTPAGGDVKRLVDRLRDVARVLDQDRVLDDRHRDAGDVGLLEAVGADQVGAHLAVRKTVGTLSIIASAIGVTRLVAPGPLVAGATPLPARLGVAPRRRGRRPARGGTARGGCRVVESAS